MRQEIEQYSMGTYIAVVGPSLDDLTKDGISLPLRIRLLRLELAADLDVLARLLVEETHSVSS